jgi:hypothetical protein
MFSEDTEDPVAHGPKEYLRPISKQLKLDKTFQYALHNVEFSRTYKQDQRNRRREKKNGHSSDRMLRKQRADTDAVCSPAAAFKPRWWHEKLHRTEKERMLTRLMARTFHLPLASINKVAEDLKAEREPVCEPAAAPEAFEHYFEFVPENLKDSVRTSKTKMSNGHRYEGHIRIKHAFAGRITARALRAWGLAPGKLWIQVGQVGEEGTPNHSTVLFSFPREVKSKERQMYALRFQDMISPVIARSTIYEADACLYVFTSKYFADL